MPPSQFQWAISKLGMKQTATARFLGISARHVYRMYHGQAEVPVAYVLLLNAMIHHDEKPVVPRRVPDTY